MDGQEKSAKDYFSFQLERKMFSLSKSFLSLLEELMNDEYNISEERFNKMRKKVLDDTNDNIREIKKYLEKLEITLK